MQSSFVSAFFLSCVMVWGMCAPSAFCQSIPDLPGSTPPAVAPGSPAGSYVLSELETVDLYSGKVNFAVPIRTVGGRGSAGYRMSVPVERGWTVVQMPDPEQPGTTWPFVLSMETPDVVYGTLPSEPDMAVEPYTPGYMIARNVTWGTPVTCTGGSGETVVGTGGHTLTKVVFIAPDGTETEFVDRTNLGQPLNAPTPPCNYGSNPTSRGTVFVALDGSARTFIASSTVFDSTLVKPFQWLINGSLFFPDGTRYDFNSAQNANFPSGHVDAIYDTKGNETQVTLDQSPCSMNGCTTDPKFAATDPLGRSTNVTLANISDSVVQDIITYSGENNQPRTVNVVYSMLGNVLFSGVETQTLANLNCLFPTIPSAAGGGQFNPWVVSAITLPNGQGYTFQYNSYGDVTNIVLPTGGSIEYDYLTIAANSCPTMDMTSGYNGFSVQRRIQQRRVYSNAGTTAAEQTTYSYVFTPGTNGGQGTTEVEVMHVQPSTGTVISQENHYYYGDPQAAPQVDPTTYTGWQESKEYQTDFLDGNGNLLRRLQTAWQQTNCGSCWFIDDASYAYPSINGTSSWESPTYHPSVASKTTTLEDTNQVSKITYDSYDVYGNPTSITEYDYGSGSPSGTPLRNTKMTYLTSGYDTVNSSTASTIHIRRAPTDVQIYNGSGTKTAETTYAYDQSSLVPLTATLTGYVAPPSAQTAACTNGGTAGNCLGNITSISRLFGSSWLTTTKTYDKLGNLNTVTDPNNNTTTYTYTDSFSTTQSLTGSTYAFATSITNALLQTTMSEYDYYLGRVTQTTDPNKIVTSYAYVDTLDRLSQEKRGSGLAQTTYSYIDRPNNVSITTTTDQTNYMDNAISNQVFYDGLGRVQQRSQAIPVGSSVEYVNVDFTYDARGRQYTASNPFNPDAGETAMLTTTLYDALSRPISVTTADGSATTLNYSGNSTTTTDPAGVQRTTVTDAAGRISSVTEHQSILTSYLYDALDDLLAVCQGSSFSPTGACTASTAESRVFGYDSLGRLMSAQNPESGTTSYSYDSNGNLMMRMDANGNTVAFSYDGLNRIQSKTYTVSTGSATPTVNYCYDGATTPAACAAAPSTGSNLIGHLTLVTSSVSSTAYSQFGKLGNVLNSNQSTSGVSYPFVYSYNLANALNKITLPSGRTVIWTYDTANRVSAIKGTPPGGTAKNYASSVSWASQGEVSQLSLGNSLVEVRSYDNWRQQPIGVTLGTSSTNASSLALTFGYCPSGMVSCTTNNGNLQSQTIGPLGVTQTYAYTDGFNRLNSASEAVGGNPTIWTESFMYDGFGNRWVSSSSGLSLSPLTPTTGTAYVVGPNTQQTNRIYLSNFGYDSNGNQTFVSPYTTDYDAENRQTSIASTMNGSATYSYDGDGRRVMKNIAGGATTTYVYDASGQLTAEYSTQPPVQLCQTCFLTVDHLGSTRVITDQNGNVVSRHDFLPFGEELTTSNRTVALNYDEVDNVTERFTGKERDAESGLDFFGTRYMSSAQGRFTSPDKPLISQDASDPQSWNLYTYVRNNPLRYTDPDGLDYHLCVDNGKGQNCFTLNDQQYEDLYKQQNGQQGVSLPMGVGGGNITCGGSVCGSVSYTETPIQDATVGLAVDYFGGKVAGAALGKVFGWFAGLFGRAATTTASAAASNVLAGKVLTGFSEAQVAMIQKALSALEAAGYNTGRLQTLIRIADAPAGYAGMSLSDGAALSDEAFSSQAMLNHTMEHELIHMDQTAQGLRGAYGPGTAQSLEQGADAQAKFPAPQQ